MGRAIDTTHKRLPKAHRARSSTKKTLGRGTRSQERAISTAQRRADELEVETGDGVLSANTLLKDAPSYGDLGLELPAPPADGNEFAEIVRFDETGHFGDNPPVPDTDASQWRHPTTAQFLGPDLEVTDPLVDRDPDTGEFEKEREGEPSLGFLDGGLFF